MAPKLLRHGDQGAIFRQSGKHEQHWDDDPRELPYYPAQDSHQWLQEHPEGQDPPEGTHHEASSTKARYILLPHWDPQQCVDILEDHAAQMSTRHHIGAPQGGFDQLIPLARSGGFTLHDHVGDAPTKGYMVSTHKSTEKTIPISQLAPGHISDYVRDHTPELSRPNSYLGGWLDGKNFYLDVSSHYPELSRAARDGAQAKQLAIYDLHNGSSINTPDAVMAAGDPGLAYPPKMKDPLLAFAQEPSQKPHNPWRHLPDHDWTQHGLGDAEDWEQDPALAPRQLDAATEELRYEHSVGAKTKRHRMMAYDGPKRVGWLDWAPGGEVENVDVHPHYQHHGIASELWRRAREIDPDIQHSSAQTAAGAAWAQKVGAAGPPKLEYYSPAPGSSHGAELWREPGTTQNWLIKHAPKGKEYLADLDVAANQIAAQSGVDTPPTFKTDLGKGPASAQQMIHGAKDAFPNQEQIDPDALSDEDLLTIQKHHALDWLIGNHDSHERQFIRDPSGKLMGIDKGQAFKYINHDQLNWNFHPNGSMYGEHEPVYNTLYRNMAKGGRVLNDPRDGELGKYVQGLSSIPDDEYRAMLTPYAQGAAKGKELGKTFIPAQHENFAPKPRFAPNDPEGFLNAAVARKNSLSDDMGRLYDKAQAHAATGTKIAMAPDMATLRQMGEQLGSHGAEVFTDPQGQWLIKRPPRGADFMVPLDVATAQLQHRAGLEVPETHAIPWHRGRHVSAIQMIPGARQAFESPPRLKDLHPKDLLTIQKHQALDWLIGNHDGHVGNFLRTPKGGLVGIDKGQAFKYYGRDKLDPTFHPNFYAREPVYNQLWRDFSDGQGKINDPRKGKLGDFVKSLQEVPDEDLKTMFRPYAHAAAHAGLLANLKDDDPRRNLSAPTIAPNDPEHFLEALATRKRNLADDLGSLYDGALVGQALTKQIHKEVPKPLPSLTVKAKVAQWFHASPQELTEGTVLAPSGGPSTFDDYEGMNYGGEDRRSHVWLSPSLKDAQQWASVIRDEGNVYPRPVHVYEAHPHQRPQGDDDDGYKVPAATIGKKVYTHDGKVH